MVVITVGHPGSHSIVRAAARMAAPPWGALPHEDDQADALGELGLVGAAEATEVDAQKSFLVAKARALLLQYKHESKDEYPRRHAKGSGLGRR